MISISSFLSDLICVLGLFLSLCIHFPADLCLLGVFALQNRSRSCPSVCVCAAQDPRASRHIVIKSYLNSNSPEKGNQKNAFRKMEN